MILEKLFGTIIDQDEDEIGEDDSTDEGEIEKWESDDTEDDFNTQEEK